MLLEFLRTDDGRDQVDQSRNGNNADKDDFHGCSRTGLWKGLADLLAETGVGDAEKEKHHGGADKDHVIHET